MLFLFDLDRCGQENVNQMDRMELMTEGHGTLTDLAKLKKEWGPRFKQAAPKIKAIDLPCFKVRCKTAMNPNRVKFSWRGLRVAKTTCTRATCPLVTLEKYLEMLERTRAFRQRNDDPESRAFWWGIVEKWKERFRRERGG
jgi:hypothetical protein